MVGIEYLLLVAGMGLVTYLPRWFPLFFLSRKPLPRWFIQWLELIPVAILSALVLPDLLVAGDPRQIEWIQPKSLAALPTFLFAARTRSLGGTVLAGMLFYFVAERFLPS